MGLVVSERPCLQIQKNYGEKVIALLRNMSIIDYEFRVKRDQDFLYLPLLREPSPSEIDQLHSVLDEFEIHQCEFFASPQSSTNLADLLRDELPPNLLASLPHSIDVVGDVAVVDIPPELENNKRVIGEATLKAFRRVRTVLAKSSPVSGIYRLRDFEVIGGVAKTETVHKEYGCVFHVDLTQAYFSPRLSYEHNRVSSLVHQGETVVDFFAGVGPFSILIAKNCAKVSVYAIDVNPNAFLFLRKNILANRVEAKVVPILGDARKIVYEKLRGLADRVIMNLPESAIEFVDAACKAIKPRGGIVHYYEFSNDPQPLESAKDHLSEAIGKTDRSLKRVLSSKIVRGIAPFTYQVVVDAEIR